MNHKPGCSISDPHTNAKCTCSPAEDKEGKCHCKGIGGFTIHSKSHCCRGRHLDYERDHPIPYPPQPTKKECCEKCGFPQCPYKISDVGCSCPCHSSKTEEKLIRCKGTTHCFGGDWNVCDCGKMNNKPPEKQGWAAERKNLQDFLAKFPNTAADVIDSAYLAGLEDRKDNLESALKAERERVIEEIKGMEKKSIRQLQDGVSMDWGYQEGYESAIQDIIKKLSEK